MRDRRVPDYAALHPGYRMCPASATYFFSAPIAV